MSNLFFNQNLNYISNRCTGFISKKYPGTVPIIYSLYSKYVSNRGVYFVSILGDNFRDYSVVRFGPNIVPAVFLGSQSLLLYISTDYPQGIYSVQVFNDIYSSNSANVNL